jgi:hypothetical protein
LATVAATLLWAAPASATILDFTTTNRPVDGTGRCLQGTDLSCNIYSGKSYVWISGGPEMNKLLPDGKYFWAVLEPSFDIDPDDGEPGNLSDDHDPYTNRTFTVTNGRITGYTGTHDYAPDSTDSNENKIRLMPYTTAANSAGVYILAVCKVPTARTSTGGGGYHPPKTYCKYDAFKIPNKDQTPPECPKPVFAMNGDGQWTATAKFKDPGGIDSISVIDIENAAADFTSFYRGTTGWVTLTAAKLDQSKGSRVVVEVIDVAGNKSICDPVLASLKARTQTFRRLSEKERVVTIRNGRPGFRRAVLSVNGRRFVVALRPGRRTKLNIGSALRAGNRNVVTVRGYGSRRAKAAVFISN